MSDDVTDTLGATEAAEGANPLPRDNTRETIASLKANSKAARLSGSRAIPAMPDVMHLKKTDDYYIAIKKHAAVHRTQLMKGSGIIAFADCPRPSNLTSHDTLENARRSMCGPTSAMHQALKALAPVGTCTSMNPPCIFLRFPNE